MEESKYYENTAYGTSQAITVKPEAEDTNGRLVPARPRPRYWLWGMAGVLIVAAAISIFVWQRTRSEAQVQSKPQAPSAPTDVVIATPEQLGQISVSPVLQRTITVDRNTTGRIAFNEDRLTPVFTPYAGRVVELLAKKGVNVRRGQPLLILDPPELLSAQNDLASARSDVAKAKISLDVATVAAERARRLHQSEALATKELQQAEADLARAQDEYRRASALLASVENRLTLFGKSKEEIAQLSSRVDRRMVINAPISGTIVDRKVGPGQYVKPDSPDPLFLISDLSTLWVLADVFETDLAGIQSNAPVEITVTAYPDRTFPALISLISPTVDPATRTVRVRCLVPNPSGLLKPDMFAKIRIRAATPRLVPVIPASALISQGSAVWVFVEEAPGRFRRRRIQAGQDNEGWVTVDSGLRPGERIVTRGGLLLNEAIPWKG